MIHLILLVALLQAQGKTNTQQQPRDEKQADVYASVPAEQREQLKEAVGKLIVAEQKHDWKSVYEMTEHEPDDTEGLFLKRSKQMHALREFRVASIGLAPSGGWYISGCVARVGVDKPGEGRKATIFARWGNGRWYLSVILLEIRCDDESMSCSTR